MDEKKKSIHMEIVEVTLFLHEDLPLILDLQEETWIRPNYMFSGMNQRVIDQIHRANTFFNVKVIIKCMSHFAMEMIIYTL